MICSPSLSTDHDKYGHTYIIQHHFERDHMPETTKAKLVNNDNKKKLGSVQAQAANPFDLYNKRVDVSSATVAEAETVGDEPQASQTRALPTGFFDDKDADLRARGITPIKLDINFRLPISFSAIPNTTDQNILKFARDELKKREG